MNFLSSYNIILGSKSPRRAQLLTGMDIEFVVKTKEVEETVPENFNVSDVPVYLSQLKAKQFIDELSSRDILITADTIVTINNRYVGKPKNREEAFRMLHILSGKCHQVISGVTLTSKEKQVSFSDITNVYFKQLSDEEINYYINQYKPYDKAGAYGIQEWIGHIGIDKIDGSYFNVMGLPTEKLYKSLQEFIELF